MAGQQPGSALSEKGGGASPQGMNGAVPAWAAPRGMNLNQRLSSTFGNQGGVPSAQSPFGAPTSRTSSAPQQPVSINSQTDEQGRPVNAPSSGGPQAPPPPSVVDTSISDFRDFLAPIQDQLGGVAQDLISRGQGDTLDPLIEAQRGQGLRGLSTQIGRSGVTGSTADNAAARMSSGFDMQQLAGRDQALQSGIGLLQGTAQNALAVPGLNISALAAQNAGQGGKK